MLLLLGALLGAPAHALKCEVAVVGAGPGGAYLAWRLSQPASSGGVGMQVCLFEMGARVGGRVHSLRRQGPRSDLTVEAGAYRFALNRTCVPMKGFEWCLETPVTKHVIINALKLNYRVRARAAGWAAARRPAPHRVPLRAVHCSLQIYDPSATTWDSQLAKLVDGSGEDAGYLTFVERLVAAAQASGGARLHLGHELLSIHKADGADGAHALRFANGAEALARHVILNLPQYPLMRVLGKSTGLSPLGAGAAPPVLRTVTAYPLLKLYVHYEDAWWRNALGLTAGFFNNSAAWKPGAAGSADGAADPRGLENCFASRQQPAPLQGAYHDAHVRCDGAPGAPRCRGYLQAAYLPELYAVRFYTQWRAHRTGDSVTHLDGKAPHDAQLLELVHEALVELHADALAAAGALERVRALRPDSAVLSIWDTPVDGIEAGCHAFQQLGLPGSGPAGASRGIPTQRIPSEALAPLSLAPRVFVANEAWGQLQCFAEGALQMAENIAHAFFKAPPPRWIPEREYREDVLYREADERARPPLGDVSLAHAAALGRAVGAS